MEELKMIIELAEKVTDGAFVVVMIYFAKGFLLSVLKICLVGFIAHVVYNLALNMFFKHSTLNKISAIIQEDAYFDSFSISDKNKLVDKIRRLAKRVDDQ